jgi:hypothetical protein
MAPAAQVRRGLADRQEVSCGKPAEAKSKAKKLNLSGFPAQVPAARVMVFPASGYIA